jgi:hypothetical protein
LPLLPVPTGGSGTTTESTTVDYYQAKAVSFSQLKHMLRSQAHFWHNTVLNPQHTPEDGSDAMRLGRAMHAALLEPDTFRARFPIAPDAKRNTKEGKAMWETFKLQHPGPDYVKASEAEEIEGMAKALSTQSIIDAQGRSIALSTIFQKGQAEQEFFWTDKETGLPCKCKTDWIMGGLVVDYKTTLDARLHAFTRTVAQYKYYMQAAFYLQGIEAVTGTRPTAFVFVAQEKEAPYCAAPYTLSADSLDFGAQQVRASLKLVAEGLASGKWQGYPPVCGEVVLPDYEFNGL